MATKREHDDARDLLKRCARACEPYGADVVVAGRMALEAYRAHPDMRDVRVGDLLGTREVDLVVPRRLGVKGAPVADLLAKESLVPYDSLALDVRKRGKRRFQDKQYDPARPAPTFVEFLTPKIGETDGILAPQPELFASALRFVELLLFEPIVVVIAGANTHVAAPSMLIAQKALMRHSPSGRRADKDLLSIYEACLLSSPRWTKERTIVDHARACDGTWKKWLARVAAQLREDIGQAADGAVAVATLLRTQKHAPSAADVATTIEDATQAMFD
jgi:hypothetical protein